MTVTTNYDRRPIEPLKDAWLIDSAGRVAGVEISQGRQQKSFLPGSAVDGAITSAGSPLGIFANLTTVPPTMPGMTVDANAQSLVYASLTVQNPDGLTVAGELRVLNWPT